VARPNRPSWRRVRNRAPVALGLAIGLIASAGSGHEAHDRGAAAAPEVLAPGYGQLEFVAPAAGTYRLPPLGPAADGAVLDESGTATTLHEVFGDRVVLLSFVYASCSDVNGCPLATAVLHRVQRELGADRALAARLRLVSLSFDPQRDTPEVMRRYSAALVGGALDWRFLTTASPDALAPTLEAYGQAVVVERDEQGRELGTLSHVLRVFLIDPQRQIRNIYTVSFLHSDTLAADVRTVLLESDSSPPGAANGGSAPLAGPGDNRTGYESAAYQTRSLALAARRGASVDLLTRAEQPVLGLPPLPIPADNSLTAAKVELGRKLFFDRRLSLNGTISCAMCHVPEQGFANNELATAVGIEGRTVRRNTPTLLNVGYRERLFYDAREDRLEHQVWAPLLAHNEMGNPSVGAVLAAIRAVPDYEGQFEDAFPGRGLAIETVGMALASYERTLVSGATPFDRWHYGGATEAMSDAAKRGFALFVGKADCVRCHTVGAEAALFADGEVHNTGVGYRAAMATRPAVRRIQVAPGQWLEVDGAIVDQVAEPRPSDLGRYEVTQDPVDRWKYLTPTLRDVSRTAPYMHDGSLTTLREVVQFYNRGGVANPTLDPGIRPLGLSESEVDDLVAFLEALTGDDVEVLVADAFAAPVGDPTQ